MTVSSEKVPNWMEVLSVVHAFVNRESSAEVSENFQVVGRSE